MATQQPKRVFSGIKSTGQPTLGNYLGAIKGWVEGQDTPGTEQIFFIPNLHSLTVRPDPDTLREDTRANATWLLAAGLDPKKVTLFRQSDVTAHAELAWVLNNYVTMGELNRMTQFKDKSQKVGAEGQLVGLYDYPVLMAADILAYDADEVPVGEDQLQHIELARDIATRFNNAHGDTFKVPKGTVQKQGARVMNLQDPTAKMSKTDDDAAGNIMLTDSSEVIERKIKRAVTDSGSEIKAGKDKPALTNLLTIYSGLTGESIADLEQRYAGKQYGEFKTDLAKVVVEALAPIQQRFAELSAQPEELEAILVEGAQRAQKIAVAKLQQVYGVIGIN